MTASNTVPRSALTEVELNRPGQRLFDGVAGLDGGALSQPRLRRVLALLTLPIGLWAIGLWAASAGMPQWPQAEGAARIAAMATILLTITLLSYFPVLLLWSFLGAEQSRAEPSAVTAAEHQGWGLFAAEIRDWYRTVFATNRYPVPLLLTVLTFTLGWTFLFFHAGPSVVTMLSSEWKLGVLVDAVAGSPPVAYGFLGAYFFSIAFLFRRYVATDLGPGVFVHVCMRTWVVVILSLVASAIGGSSVSAGGTVVSSEQGLRAIAFAGGWTPNILIDFVLGLVKRTLGRASRHQSEEIGLNVLQGMNPWKAARLGEEGVDNIQNLAMEDPSRLVVVTRENGLRVLDWIDQALLYNYLSPASAYDALSKVGVRTAYDLYLCFRAAGLVEPIEFSKELVTRYKVDAPRAADFKGTDPITLRNVMLSIVHHPNFEKIKQMREQSSRTQQSLFTVELVTVDKPDLFETLVPTSETVKGEARQRWPSVLGIEDPATHLVVATAFLVAPDLAITPTYLQIKEPLFGVVTGRSKAKPRLAKPGVRGDLLAMDEGALLAIWRLERVLGPAMLLAAKDPSVGERVRRVGPFSTDRVGTVNAIEVALRVDGFRTDGMTKHLVALALPSKPGSGGSPIINDANEVVGVSLIGSVSESFASPVSRVRALLARSARPKKSG